MQPESILSCVRIKPLSNKDEESSCMKFDDKSVLLLKSNEKYNFEIVFDENSKNDEIFDILCKRLMDDAFHGINTCIFAYGQTSSGKTFTMKGTNENPGIIPKSISYVFKKVSETVDISVEVKVSYLEIYNESINDLLKKDNNNLEVRENLSKGIYIQNLSEIQVKNEQDAFEFFCYGETLRKFGDTSLNDESSRSHTVFRLHFEVRNKERPDKISFSVVNLVDLAGSEGVSRAKTEGIRKKEGANINKSLLALSTVISKLSQKDCPYINFRDSKLTRLLQPCLGGNSRTAVICTINPQMTNISETINTLKFGMNAGVIKNQIKLNERERFEKSSMEKFTVEKNLFDLTIKENNELKLEISKCDDQIACLVEKANSLEVKNSEFYERMSILTNEVDFLKNENQNLKINNEILLKETENLRKNNQELMRIVKEFKEIEKQNQSFLHLQKKLQALEEEKQRWESENISEKNLLKNKIDSLTEELKTKDLKISEFSKENSNLLRIVKDISSYSKNQEKQEILNENKENHNFLNNNTSGLFKDENCLKLKINKRLSENIKNDVSFEENLENLEFTSNLSAKIFQKNRILSHMNEKIMGMEKFLTSKDDRIFELTNELLYYKNLYGPALNLSMTSMEMPSMNSISKKKIDEYSYVQKKVKCSPDKDELKREIKYLECKTRNVEKQLIRKKQIEAENYKRIEFLNNKTQMLSNKLEEKYLTFETLLEL